MVTIGKHSLYIKVYKCELLTALQKVVLIWKKTIWFNTLGQWKKSHSIVLFRALFVKNI